MLVHQWRAAITTAPRTALPEISAALWRAWGQGEIPDAEAQALAEVIAARKAIPAAPKAPQRRLGSRPKTHASLERRRSWAASGWMPPTLAARFTTAETAVLAVIAVEHLRHGRCTLPVACIAAKAGVCAQTVRNALRAAQGLVHVEQRRVTAARNLPNRITIVSAEWRSWLRRRGASKFVGGTGTQENSKAPAVLPKRPLAAGRLNAQGGRPRPDDEGSRAFGSGLRQLFSEASWRTMVRRSKASPKAWDIGSCFFFFYGPALSFGLNMRRLDRTFG